MTDDDKITEVDNDKKVSSTPDLTSDDFAKGAAEPKPRVRHQTEGAKGKL
jgi:hypothetical protein